MVSANIKDRWSIVIPVYDQYELFRQCFESVLYNLSVENVIIVDDYSYPHGKLREYEDYIEKRYEAVKVIKSDEYRRCFHANDSDMVLDEQQNKSRNMNMTEKSRGHRFAIQTGINQVDTDFVLILDADCVALYKTRELLEKLTEIFDIYDDCMCIGQVAGLMTNSIEKVTKGFNIILRNKINTEGGCPGSPAVACRMDGWKKHGLISVADKPSKAGWAYAYYTHDIFKKGFSIINFPILSHKYFFHVGGGILCFARAGRRSDCHLGMCKDTAVYGGRGGINRMEEWYHGRYVLNMTSMEYVKYLIKKYNTPYEDIQPPLNENLLYIVKDEVKS